MKQVSDLNPFVASRMASRASSNYHNQGVLLADYRMAKWVRRPSLNQAVSLSASRTDCACIVSNGGTWAFGGAPVGNSGLLNARSNAAQMTSFAQTIGASQTGTPLDLS